MRLDALELRVRELTTKLDKVEGELRVTKHVLHVVINETDDHISTMLNHPCKIRDELASRGLKA